MEVWSDNSAEWNTVTDEISIACFPRLNYLLSYDSEFLQRKKLVSDFLSQID